MRMCMTYQVDETIYCNTEQNRDRSTVDEAEAARIMRRNVQCVPLEASIPRSQCQHNAHVHRLLACASCPMAPTKGPAERLKKRRKGDNPGTPWRSGNTVAPRKAAKGA